jgi:hypothetical protein
LKLAAGGAAVLVVGAGTRLSQGPSGKGGPGSGQGGLILSTGTDSDVASVDVTLDDALSRISSDSWQSREMTTSTHSMVALTWNTGQPLPVAYTRSRRSGSWSGWTRLPVLDDLAGAVGEGPTATAGTDVIWVGPSDGVQVRVSGERPAGLRLVLLFPRQRPGDRQVGQVAEPLLSARTGDGSVGRLRPALVSRKEWGADESLRDGDPSYIRTIKQVHIHHTASSNDYHRDDVPALLRGMYAYHTRTLGWSDIGYNFLVDRFGRCWVGRAGGPAKPVRGAHTLGFNHESTGISAIGNYETARPGDRLLQAIAALAAWKLDPFERDARGSIRVESEGSDKYAAGRKVRLPVIDGHRDTNDTACPGRHLYDALPTIRRRTARMIAEAHRTSIVVTQPAHVAGAAQLGRTLRVDLGRFTPEDATVTYRWIRGGRSIRGAREQEYDVRPWDVGHKLGCEVTLSRDGLEPVTQTPPPLGPCTARPTVKVNTSSRRRVARIDVAVVAPDQVRPVPSGTVSIALGQRRKIAALQRGHAAARFGRYRRLPAGTYTVEVTYRGDDAFVPVTVTSTLTIG